MNIEYKKQLDNIGIDLINIDNKLFEIMQENNISNEIFVETHNNISNLLEIIKNSKEK